MNSWVSLTAVKKSVQHEHESNLCMSKHFLPPSTCRYVVWVVTSASLKQGGVLSLIGHSNFSGITCAPHLWVTQGTNMNQTWSKVRTHNAMPFHLWAWMLLFVILLQSKTYFPIHEEAMDCSSMWSLLYQLYRSRNIDVWASIRVHCFEYNAKCSLPRYKHEVEAHDRESSWDPCQYVIKNNRLSSKNRGTILWGQSLNASNNECILLRWKSHPRAFFKPIHTIITGRSSAYGEALSKTMARVAVRKIKHQTYM